MRARLAVLCVMLASLGAPRDLPGQAHAFGRIEGGTLNAGDPFNTTLAFGAAIGVSERSSSFLFRLVRQSRNRNSGSDVGDARTFALLEWELAGKPEGAMQRQPFFRLGAGLLFQSPFKTAWAADLGVGLRYRVVPRLVVVGALVDQVDWIRNQTSVDCDVISCTTATVPTQTQHNFGLLVDLEVRL